MRQRFLLYFSGGVSHNSKAMHEIANLNLVKSFTVPPSPGTGQLGAQVLGTSFQKVNL